MNILETEWWCLGVPPEWWAEHEDDVMVIGDQDDVGVIEISTLRKEQGQFSAEETAAIARDNDDAGCDWSKVWRGDFSGVATAYADADQTIREWYLSADDCLLFITYSCDREHHRLDDAAVDEILDTLRVLQSAD